MGRIRTTYVKRIARKMLETHESFFGKDMNKNKKAMNELAEIYSKPIRNKIAGEILHLIKQKEKKESDQAE
jgi:small subunit ribosomal protein S17e